MKPACVLVLLAACSSQPERAASIDPVVGKVKQGSGLIGSPAPSLDGVRWIDPPGATEGKVVLVRWWTTGCPLCTNSAPAIAELKRKHGAALEVRAIFHEKVAGRELPDEDLKEIAEDMGLPGVLGRDPGWSVLRRWWLDAGGRSFTSVTFVLGKGGRIRQIHTGGEFHAPRHAPACLYDPERCADEYRAIDRAIGVLAAEPG
ncbi:MAG: peroxiredoxin family protein [Planctomycetota bacterium]|jgi:thiol-disulfide isomerase/thioredoxin